MGSLIDKEDTGLVIIDVQEKLMNVMNRKDKVTDNIITFLHLSELYHLPVIVTEQYPRWLGRTLPEIKTALPAYTPIDKIHFNCCDVDPFNRALESQGLRTIILTGVETHICVFQTCISLLERGYTVHVPQDAVASRTEENWKVGLALMRQAGASITSTETDLYLILKKAGTKEFKEMLRFMR